MALSTNDETMELVMKNIYSSCDPENSNLVPSSKLLEFITPYMLEDLSALESLRCLLDPDNNNVCVSSEKFYEVMNEWTKKIANTSDEDEDTNFNKTPNALDVIDEKKLPYIQSTPRASFGQKLLSCEGLLNLSNVSAYSLSTSMQGKDSSTAGLERTILEEELKRLEHHLNKVSNEMVMVKLQLTTAEEQNDLLQADLDRCKTRLHSEQQVIEHLQSDKRYNDELREELNSTKRQLETLNKKVLQYEKDNHHLLNVIKETEKENSKLEEKCEELSRREQEAKKEIINIKTELDLKDQEITTIYKINTELRSKLNQQRDVIDQLTNENELLEHQKNNLEKILQEKLSARRDSLVHQYKSGQGDTGSLHDLDESVEEECHFESHSMESKGRTRDSLHAEISQVIHEKGNFPCSSSLVSFENNERLMQFEDNVIFGNVVEVYRSEIEQLKIKNDSIQAKLEIAVQDNMKLQQQITEMKEKTSTTTQDLNNILIEKKDKEARLDQIEVENANLESDIKQLKQKIAELTDQNNNLLEKEKSMESSLESKNKIMAELENNLLELKRQFTNLQIENIAKEKELSAKFDFEAAFKETQKELNEKNEQIESLNELHEDLVKCWAKLTTANEKLEQSLRQAEEKLKENEDKSNQMMSINENIALTATQVQIHLDRKNDVIKELVELNKKFESSIASLEKDLQSKMSEITELRDNLANDMEIKNIMWRDNKELKLQLDAQIKSNDKLSDEMKEIEERREQAYNELLSNYNKEVEKNCELCDQIYTYKNELSSSISKYNEEVDKNRNLYEQVCALKEDIDAVREGQDEYKATINKKLTDYEGLINSLEKKLSESELQNTKLQNTLAVTEKRRSLRCFNVDSSSSEGGKNRSFEKQKLTIDRLKEKLENVEEQLQREKTKREILEQSLKNKDDINEERCGQLENKLRETEDGLTIKLSQLEQQNQRLFTEVRNNEFVIKNAHLEIETYKNLFQNADQKAQELSKTISVYLLESNNKQKEIQLLSMKLGDKDNKIHTLSSKIAERDTELASILKELAEKKNLILTLEKENKSLQEMLSKSDDSKEKELLDVEQKLKNTHELLQSSQMELGLVEKKLSESKEKYELMCNETTRHDNVITRSRAELARASGLVFNKWDDILQRESIYNELLLLKESEPSEKGGEIRALDNNIKIAVLLLEILATKAPIPMEGTDYGINNLLSANTNKNQYSQSDVKMIKKFTLRPSRLLITRPVSPDSPSLDITEVKAETPQEINFNTSTEIYINQNANRYICPHSTDDSYETAHDELSFTKDKSFEFMPLQEAFPSISDTFLEKLGLHEDSSKQNLTKEQMEQRFATLAIQIVLDSRDVKERLQKQKDRCVQQHEKFLSIIRDISNRLRDHKCIGATDPISPVFVLLEDVKFLLRDFTQSAEQFGVLICENRMMKCWNLVTNYMASLKQDINNLQVVQSAQERKQQIETSTSFAIFGKRLLNLNRRDEVNSSSSVSSSEAIARENRRYKFCDSIKNSITLCFAFLILILILLISMHWHCRMSASENQICVLDDFIKKIQIGVPPY